MTEPSLTRDSFGVWPVKSCGKPVTASNIAGTTRIQRFILNLNMFPPVDNARERQKANRPQSIKRFPREDCQYLMNISSNLSRQNTRRNEALALCIHQSEFRRCDVCHSSCLEGKGALTSQKIAPVWPINVTEID